MSYEYKRVCYAFNPTSIIMIHRYTINDHADENTFDYLKLFF